MGQASFAEMLFEMFSQGGRKKGDKLAVHPSVLGLSMEPKKVANSSI